MQRTEEERAIVEYAETPGGTRTHIVAGRLAGVVHFNCARWLNQKMYCRLVEEPILPLCQVCLALEDMKEEKK